MGDMTKVMVAKMKKMKEQQKGINNVTEIPLERLLENPYQPRIEIKPDEVKELADSIKEQGLIQPIVVTKADNGNYYIVGGHRRVEAHRLLGKDKIKAYVIEADENKLASMAIVENLQREDLDLIETAIALKQYKEKFSKTDEEIAKEIGKSRSAVTQMLNVLNLPDRIIKDVKENKSTKDVTALNWLNSFYKKLKKSNVSVLTKSQNPEKSGSLESVISQKWEDEVFELYQGFLKNGREWLKKEIENRLKREEKAKPKVELKITKKNGITIKIRENLSLDDKKKEEFEEELQRLIEKYKKEVKLLFGI